MFLKAKIPYRVHSLMFNRASQTRVSEHFCSVWHSTVEPGAPSPTSKTAWEPLLSCLTQQLTRDQETQASPIVTSNVMRYLVKWWFCRKKYMHFTKWKFLKQPAGEKIYLHKKYWCQTNNKKCFGISGSITLQWEHGQNFKTKLSP